jgi:hypothetical protein
MANNLVMYAQGGDYSSLYNSGFTTVILNSFHIHSDGSLWWNDTEVVASNGAATSNMPGLQAVVSGLQGNGIGTVLLSVGGGGEFKPNPNGINGYHSVSDSDFEGFNTAYWAATGMTSPLSNGIPVLGAFAELLSGSGANGIDLDPEPMFYSYEALASATLILTEWAQQQKAIVTWVPFTAQASWQAYGALLSAAGQPAPSWINVQPPGWNDAASLASWTSLGVAIGQIVAGYDGPTPGEIQQSLAAVVNAGTAITGAYIWNLDGLGGTPSDFAKAINAGLAGQAS